MFPYLISHLFPSLPLSLFYFLSLFLSLCLSFSSFTLPSSLHVLPPLPCSHLHLSTPVHPFSLFYPPQPSLTKPSLSCHHSFPLLITSFSSLFFSSPFFSSLYLLFYSHLIYSLHFFSSLYLLFSSHLISSHLFSSLLFFSFFLIHCSLTSKQVRTTRIKGIARTSKIMDRLDNDTYISKNI